MNRDDFPELTNLPEGQREIMEIVWDHSEISVFEVREILNQQRPVSRTAVRTTMERLEAKGWLTHRIIGRTHFYRALVSRNANLGQRVIEFINKSCGGKPEQLMAALMEHRGLTADEIKRLQEMLEQSRAKKSRK